MRFRPIKKSIVSPETAHPLHSITVFAAKEYPIKSENKELSRVLRAAQLFIGNIFLYFSIFLYIINVVILVFKYVLPSVVDPDQDP
jgi:hypothetical protein